MPPNPKVVKAFRAMRDLGISEEKVKPVLKKLLKLYDKNWDLIEEENYRALADAIFDSDEAEAAKRKEELENSKQEQVVREEAQEPDELGRPLKRLCSNYQGQASEQRNSSTLLAGTSLVTPKDEPVELPEVQPENQVPRMVSTKLLNNGNRMIESHHLSFQSLDRNKGQQPVSPKPLTFRERTGASQPVSNYQSQMNMTIGSVAVPHPPSLETRGKKALSSHCTSEKKMLESDRSSQAIPQEKTVGHQILVQPKEEPLVGDAPVYDLRETSKEGDSSRKSCSERVQNGSVPLTAETQVGKHTSQLEIASSSLGEVKICLSYNISPQRPDFQVPSLAAVVKLVEEKYLKSYKNLDANFSLMKLMENMCDGVVELGFDSSNKSAETS